MDDVKRRPGRPPKPLRIVDGAVGDPVRVEIDRAELAKAIAEDPRLPASVTLAHLYSYYHDDGLLRTWGQGVVVTDPAEIADLIARGAPLK